MRTLILARLWTGRQSPEEGKGEKKVHSYKFPAVFTVSGAGNLTCSGSSLPLPVTRLGFHSPLTLSDSSHLARTPLGWLHMSQNSTAVSRDGARGKGKRFLHESSSRLLRGREMLLTTDAPAGEEVKRVITSGKLESGWYTQQEKGEGVFKFTSFLAFVAKCGRKGCSLALRH